MLPESTDKQKMGFRLNLQDKPEYWMSCWGKTIQDELSQAANSLQQLGSIIWYDKPANALTEDESKRLAGIVRQGIEDTIDKLSRSNEVTQDKKGDKL